MSRRRNIERERLAQYFTPPPVADFLADLLNIKPEEMVIDPACGEADLLLAANRQVQQKHGTAADVYGIDISHEAVEVARKHLTEVGLSPERIAEGDTLVSPAYVRKATE
jgi:type I restriction enzyme M protein